MDVDLAAEDMSRNQFAQQFSDEYTSIVGNSPNRETVLRAFASWRTPDIPTSEVHKIVKSKLGVKNPSFYKAQLASVKYGRPIHSLHGHDGARMTFANDMFKVYIRLTPSVHDEIDVRVREAFKDVLFRR